MSSARSCPTSSPTRNPRQGLASFPTSSLLKEMSCFLGILGLFSVSTLLAGTEPPDLPAIAKQTRPAVYLLVLQDEDGNTIGAGTGFSISSEGLLVTNQHVIAGAHSVVAKAENGGLFPVTRIVAIDKINDLALLEIKAKDLPFLSLAPDGSAEAGTRIAVVGSPLGLEGTLTEGIVSARRRLPKERRDVLQISAPISKGSSGSPVLDAQGRVIGVASFLLQDGQSLNFASPSEKLRLLLKKFGPSTSSQATPPTSPVQNKPATSPTSYVVKNGDTLSRISRDLAKRGINTSPEEIRTLNHLPTNSVLRPGQILKTPTSHP
ncbi:MAG: LysM peptidoglycan-binding domain-containing protein [Verrucomicrobia bacterium]|nr:LysM peptidoglycan-binding domain-containing protein [Verrucomicrobiota bacterium]NBS49966.1 LysM peptidoglycan-binding domain-containing protein [Verrucomicrobiota bacterium]NBS78698.1 LysM peptidoglycan-binding domain-containing protein [bacterium]